MSETGQRPRIRGGRGAVVPDATPRTYYDQPIIKPPVWTWEIPTYFFVGGMAGASSVLARVASAVGNDGLARVARRTAAAGAVASPALLISDLGRPDRFHHMLRVAKVTSPMSVGSWILALYGPASVGSALLGELGWFPRLGRAASSVAAVLGPALSTYTAVLISDTAVPVWHEARAELPALFAAGSVASAGAVAVLARPADAAATTTAFAGTVAELVATEAMHRRLGALGAPYETGPTGRLARTAKFASAAGAALLALGGRKRSVRRAGAMAALAGAALQRWAVFRAGFDSAADPAATAGPQRARLRERTG